MQVRFGKGSLIIAAYLMITSLDYFQEKSWTVLAWFCENLQQITIFIIINKDFQLLELEINKNIQ